MILIFKYAFNANKSRVGGGNDSGKLQQIVP